MTRRIKRNWIVPVGEKLTERDEIILDYQAKGYLVPSRSLIKTEEQVEGIREAGRITRGVLDLVEGLIKDGVSTEYINKMSHEYTLDHGGIPAPLNYEGFPKSICLTLLVISSVLSSLFSLLTVAAVPFILIIVTNDIILSII